MNLQHFIKHSRYRLVTLKWVRSPWSNGINVGCDFREDPIPKEYQISREVDHSLGGFLLLD